MSTVDQGTSYYQERFTEFLKFPTSVSGNNLNEADLNPAGLRNLFETDLKRRGILPKNARLDKPFGIFDALANTPSDSGVLKSLGWMLASPISAALVRESQKWANNEFGLLMGAATQKLPEILEKMLQAGEEIKAKFLARYSDAATLKEVKDLLDDTGSWCSLTILNCPDDEGKDTPVFLFGGAHQSRSREKYWSWGDCREEWRSNNVSQLVVIDGKLVRLKLNRDIRRYYRRRANGEIITWDREGAETTPLMSFSLMEDRETSSMILETARQARPERSLRINDDELDANSSRLRSLSKGDWLNAGTFHLVVTNVDLERMTDAEENMITQALNGGRTEALKSAVRRLTEQEALQYRQRGVQRVAAAL